MAMEDVATDEAELSLEIERRMDLPRDHARLEIGCMVVDCLDDQLGDLFTAIVPRASVRQFRRELLEEQARNVLPGRRQGVNRQTDAGNS